MKLRLTILLWILVCAVFGQISYYEKARAIYGSNNDSAIYYIKKSWNDLKDKDDPNDIIKTQYLLIALLERGPKGGESDRYIDTFYMHARAKKSRLLLANAYFLDASHNDTKRNYAAALEKNYKAYELFTQEKDAEGAFRCILAIIEINRNIGKFEDAKGYIKKAEELIHANVLKSQRLIAFYYNRMAALYNETSDHRKAITYSLRSISINNSTGNYEHLALSYNELGFSYKNLMMYDSAEYNYRKSVQIFRQNALGAQAIVPLNNLALLYIEQKRPFKEVSELFNRIIDLKNETGSDFELTGAYNYLKNEYFKMGNYQKAYHYYDLYHREFNERENKIKNAAIDEIKEKYKNEQMASKIKEVNKDLKLSNERVAQEKKQARMILSLLPILLAFVVLISVLLIQRNRANRLLSVKNKEKDALIQEIHHRVKNNLQFISSLINMQLNFNNDDAESRSLNETSRRIKSMALVHEMLYNQSNDSSLKISQYLAELTHTINDMVNIQNKPIDFDLQIEDFYFKTPQAIALGMITSELISNAIKYAFNSTAAPAIQIRLVKNSADEYEFSLKDNGRGPHQSKDATGRLGMRLIDIFSRQLKGSYRFTSENGWGYELTFK